MDQINQNAHEIGKISKLMEDIAFQTNEAPVNGGRNYNGPKVAKFLVSTATLARSTNLPMKI